MKKNISITMSLYHARMCYEHYQYERMPDSMSYQAALKTVIDQVGLDTVMKWYRQELKLERERCNNKNAH